MFSTITPLTAAALADIQCFINDPARFTKNFPILHKIFNTRYGQPGRSLVPGAILDPIVIPIEGDPQ